MLAMSMFIPTQTGGPAGSARHGDQPGSGTGCSCSEDGGLSEEGAQAKCPPPHLAAARRKRPPPPSSTQAASAVGRAARSGRAHPTYPRSRVLGECRSLSTACPPSPSQRTCSQDRSRCGRDGGQRQRGQAAARPPAPSAHTRAPCPAPGPLPVNPPATLPLGAAHHRHQHWGREDAEKPSSRKAPHPSAAPRHGGGGAPPPSRPAAGAAPAAAAAAAALARSGGGRRGRGRGGGGGAGAGRGGAAGAGARGGGKRERAGGRAGGRALPPASAAAERDPKPGGGQQAGAAAARRGAELALPAPLGSVRPRKERIIGDCDVGRDREGNALRFPPPPPRPDPFATTPAQLRLRPSPRVQRSASARGTASYGAEREAAWPGGSPYLTCGALSLASPGSRRARWATGEPGARSTWRCSSDLT